MKKNYKTMSWRFSEREEPCCRTSCCMHLLSHLGVQGGQRWNPRDFGELVSKVGSSSFSHSIPYHVRDLGRQRRGRDGA